MLETDGTPFVVYNSVVKAITSILDQACKFDANLDGYVDHCLKPVEEQLDMYLSGVKSKEDLVKNGVNQVSKNILENVVDMIKKVGDLTDTVKKKVDGMNPNRKTQAAMVVLSMFGLDAEAAKLKTAMGAAKDGAAAAE